MKVFISWSGEGSPSHTIALFLRDWLPLVIQAIEPYVSSEDIEKGVSWFANVSDELKSSNFGIVCVNKENMESSWLHFETGALSNTFGHSHVCPLLINFASSDLKGPLVQFQTTQSQKSDFYKLIKTLNNNLGKSVLNETQLETLFETFWPKLETKFKEVSTKTDSSSKDVSRSDRELLNEILTLSRQVVKTFGDQEKEGSVLRESMDNFQDLAKQMQYRFEEHLDRTMKMHMELREVTEMNIAKNKDSSLRNMKMMEDMSYRYREQHERSIEMYKVLEDNIEKLIKEISKIKK
ncbi:MAG: hypothetical protein H6696_14735 [Deferribacteres bacterium]|nr:hypothetical protein [Deferribacteres bacterium]